VHRRFTTAVLPTAVAAIGVTLAASAATTTAGREDGTPLTGPAAVSGRAYVANEATGTVSVIDTRTDTITSTICLGSDPAIPGTPQPAGPCNAATQRDNPFYNGQSNAHGLWLSDDASVLLVANRLTSTVQAIDTVRERPLGYLPVGREPHLATVRPGGAEAWVAVRGEDYVEVVKLDRGDLFDERQARTARMESQGRRRTGPGPSMVAFTSDGRSAFVAHGKAARVDKVDAATLERTGTRPVPAAFTPFGLVSPDDRELWLVHKGAGTVSVLRTDDLSPVVEGLPVGTRPNHIAFVGPYAYVTVGGPAGGPEVQGKVVVLDRRTKAVVRELAGPAFTGEPHAIWATGGGKLYVGHETGNRVTVLATNDPADPADDEVRGTVGGAERDLAFLRKPIDVVAAP
jgi:YVTN family beta-propeller protein